MTDVTDPETPWLPVEAKPAEFTSRTETRGHFEVVLLRRIRRQIVAESHDGIRDSARLLRIIGRIYGRGVEP